MPAGRRTTTSCCVRSARGSRSALSHNAFISGVTRPAGCRGWIPLRTPPFRRLQGTLPGHRVPRGGAHVRAVGLWRTRPRSAAGSGAPWSTPLAHRGDQAVANRAANPRGAGHPAEALPAQRGTPIVVSVAREGPRREIRAALAAMGFDEGRDFVCGGLSPAPPFTSVIRAAERRACGRAEGRGPRFPGLFRGTPRAESRLHQAPRGLGRRARPAPATGAPASVLAGRAARRSAMFVRHIRTPLAALVALAAVPWLAAKRQCSGPDQRTRPIRTDRHARDGRGGRAGLPDRPPRVLPEGGPRTQDV